VTRLQDIDPERLAEEVTGWLTAYRWRLDMAISLHGGDTRYPPTTWQSSDVGRAVHQVAVYARTGVPPEHRQELFPEYLQTIGEAVWQAPHPDVYQMVPFPWASGAGEPSTDLDVVLVAAVGREWIGDGRPVTQLMVACLSGLTVQSVRDLISAGELRAEARDEDDKRVRLIEAAEARRWLAARGAPGHWAHGSVREVTTAS
jgi:hypothetical protein